MKKILVLVIIIGVVSCVQKTKKHSLTLLLDVSENENIKTVGVCGSDKPLSWDYDVELIEVKKDSLYKKTFEIKTGRLCTEVKFTINGDFELKDSENRKIYFNKNRNTIFKAKFDK